MAVCYNANRRITSFCLRLIRYFRRFSVIFIHDSRHGGTSETIGSLPISWKSHPSMVLIEPPPLLESVAGRKYHYPPAFLRRLWLLSKGLWFVFFARFFKVMADITFGCRDFIPTVWLTYLQSWYSVVKILSRKFSELVSSIFPFTTYWQRNWDL